MIKRKTSLRALTLIARILGRKRGVEVIFDPNAQTASTDSKVIRLPVFETVGGSDEAVLINGLVDHESAHCRFTNFDVVGRIRSPILHSLHNIVEDVWIEREQARIYPGCWENITGSMDVMIGRGMYTSPDAASTGSKPRVFVNCILHYMLARHYGNDVPQLQPMAKAWAMELSKVIGVDKAKEALSLTHEVDRVRDTKHAFVVAEKLVKFLDQEEVRQEMGGAPKNYDPKDIPENTDRGSLMVTQLPVQPPGAVKPMMPGQGGPLSLVPDSPGYYQKQAEAKSRGVASRLGSRLDEMLRAKIEDDVTYGSSGNRLSGNRLAGLSVGQTSVFVRSDEVDGISFSLTIVLDLSGSMFGDADDCDVVPALACVYSLFDVLSAYNVPTALVGYGSKAFVMKSFETPWKAVKQTKLDYDLVGTDTAPALSMGAHMLVNRPEKRNMLLLVTDGATGGMDTVNTILDEVSASMPRVEQAAILVASSGSCPVDLKRAYESRNLPTSVVGPGVDLAKAIFEVVRSSM